MVYHSAEVACFYAISAGHRKSLLKEKFYCTISVVPVAVALHDISMAHRALHCRAMVCHVMPIVVTAVNGVNGAMLLFKLSMWTLYTVQ